MICPHRSGWNSQKANNPNSTADKACTGVTCSPVGHASGPTLRGGIPKSSLPAGKWDLEGVASLQKGVYAFTGGQHSKPPLTPAGVRAAPKLGPEPKKPQQHIGTREHPEPRGETALRGRETRQLGFRPSKREIEGEQRHVLETHRHRWRVIPTCESERSVYTCGVARRTASLGSGNSVHHRVPGTPNNCSHAGSPQAELLCRELAQKQMPPAARAQAAGLGRPLPSRTC